MLFIFFLLVIPAPPIFYYFKSQSWVTHVPFHKLNPLFSLACLLPCLLFFPPLRLLINNFFYPTLLFHTFMISLSLLIYGNLSNLFWNHSANQPCIFSFILSPSLELPFNSFFISTPLCHARKKKFIFKSILFFFVRLPPSLTLNLVFQMSQMFHQISNLFPHFHTSLFFSLPFCLFLLCTFYFMFN